MWEEISKKTTGKKSIKKPLTLWFLSVKEKRFKNKTLTNCRSV
jgi:hypothetical protein